MNIAVTTPMDVNEADVENDNTATDDLPLALPDIPSPTCEQLLCLCWPQFQMSLLKYF